MRVTSDETILQPSQGAHRSYEVAITAHGQAETQRIEAERRVERNKQVAAQVERANTIALAKGERKPITGDSIVRNTPWVVYPQASTPDSKVQVCLESSHRIKRGLFRLPKLSKPEDLNAIFLKLRLQDPNTEAAGEPDITVGFYPDRPDQTATIQLTSSGNISTAGSSEITEVEPDISAWSEIDKVLTILEQNYLLA